MELNGLIQHMRMNESKTITIDCDMSKEYPGYVRTITIKNDNTIRVEFEVYGYDEGGITFFIQYKNFELLIYSLEKYLEKEIEEWDNINQSGHYPEAIDCDIRQTNKIIKLDLVNDNIKLPVSGDKIWIPDGFWKKLHDGVIPLN